MKADLRRRRNDGERRAVMRPGNGVDIVENRTPPTAVGAVGVYHVDAGEFGFDDGVNIRKGIGKARVGQDGIAGTVGRDLCPVNASGQSGERGRGCGRGRGSVRRRQGQGGELRHFVDFGKAIESSAGARKPGGFEFFRKIEVARFATTGRDQIPFAVGGAFVSPKLHAIENVLAIRRHGDRGGAVQTGGVVETEGMVGGLRDGQKRKHRTECRSEGEIAHCVLRGQPRRIPEDSKRARNHSSTSCLIPLAGRDRERWRRHAGSAFWRSLLVTVVTWGRVTFLRRVSSKGYESPISGRLL